MPRFRAERAKRKIDPLIQHGQKVLISYTNPRAFEVRTKDIYSKEGEFLWTREYPRVPTAELTAWLTANAGPRGVLWTTEKTSSGINFYFAVPGQAMMCKLAWGGL